MSTSGVARRYSTARWICVAAVKTWSSSVTSVNSVSTIERARLRPTGTPELNGRGTTSARSG